MRLPLTVWTRGWTVFSRCLFFATIAVASGVTLGLSLAVAKSGDFESGVLGMGGSVGGAVLGTALLRAFSC